MENLRRLHELIANCWKDIFKEVQNAAVYIDQTAGECLHWYSGDKGYLSLKDAGAVSIHELAAYNFNFFRAPGVKKAVIVSTSNDPIFYHRILKLIIESNTFNKYVIISSAYFDLSISDNIKSEIKSLMDNKNSSSKSSIEIQFMPIFVCFLGQNVFVTPPFGALIPSVTEKPSSELECEISSLITSLKVLFNCFSIETDVYALGNFSKYVANEFDKLVLKSLIGVPSKKKFELSNETNEKPRMSLIFVDRTLDLCTATSNNNESMLGRIINTLPHLAGHYNDVAINMTSFFGVSKEISQEQTFTLPGCLATEDKNIIDLLILKNQKEILSTMNEILNGMLTSKKDILSAKVPTRISVHSLEKQVDKFLKSESPDSLLKSSKRLQIIMAIIQTLKSDKTAQIELLISLEKLILQNLAVSGDSSSILTQLSNILKTRESRGLNTESLLALLIHIFALVGTQIKFSSQHMEQLKSAITDAVYEDIKACNEDKETSEMSTYQQTLLLLGISDDKIAKNTANDISEHIMKTLRAITEQRDSLQDYISLMERPSPQEMVQCIGVLEQLVSDLLHPDKPELRDLYYTHKSRHHPCQNSWMIIYVIGGITPEECRKMQNLVSSLGSNCHVTIAGTRMINPLDLMNKILLSSMR